MVKLSELVHCNIVYCSDGWGSATARASSSLWENLSKCRQYSKFRHVIGITVFQGIVAMDLLNRPKTHASNMHDLPSTSNSECPPHSLPYFLYSTSSFSLTPPHLAYCGFTILSFDFPHSASFYHILPRFTTFYLKSAATLATSHHVIPSYQSSRQTSI